MRMVHEHAVGSTGSLLRHGAVRVPEHEMPRRCPRGDHSAVRQRQHPRRRNHGLRQPPHIPLSQHQILAGFEPRVRRANPTLRRPGRGEDGGGERRRGVRHIFGDEHVEDGEVGGPGLEARGRESLRGGRRRRLEARAAGAARRAGGGGRGRAGLLLGAGSGEEGGDVGGVTAELGEDGFVPEDILLSPALVLRCGGAFRHFGWGGESTKLGRKSQRPAGVYVWNAFRLFFFFFFTFPLSRSVKSSKF